MVFSSPTFLFLFLPLVLAGASLTGPLGRNAFLCGASLLFYAWGEPLYVLLIMVSILLNYVCGIALTRNPDAGRARLWLAAGITANLLILGHFKYANFLVKNLDHALAWFQVPPIPNPGVALPIGISFFTFQALSYLIDVYRRAVPAERNLVNLALYISMFPQLIAGPIVRYEQVAARIRQRQVTMPGFASGVERFVIGLAKKMLLANPAGAVADAAFAAPPDGLTAGFAWLGLAGYTVQIYFDFSGYSDMAIGLGRMFGFDYPENFRYPYCARSLREFWRRWHISLSTWFRDYLYLPLGGNRRGEARTWWNLFVVFTLCGLWHGANWNFLLWGWWHGGFLIAERAGLGRLLDRLPAPLQHAYTLVVVMVGWALFRADTPGRAVAYLQAMAGTNMTIPDGNDGMLPPLLLTMAAVAATPLGANWLRAATDRARDYAPALLGLGFARILLLSLAFSASASFVAADTYNPFIYFRF
jgi:alginate O-acetyltransferase complex protein AlgI